MWTFIERPVFACPNQGCLYSVRLHFILLIPQIFYFHISSPASGNAQAYPHFSCPLSDGEIFDFLGISVPGANMVQHRGGGWVGPLGSVGSISPSLVAFGAKVGILG